ncbi:unnamed protein product [Brassicogethes aeneus]|uniref:Regulatory protein zeste n=1 Tax=Brassicogethes aeneus TaxID=1431903 RepID=A0A9P0BB38_BRAAE|nr:unnamed protein product [Brassicogethes aeneus]
MMDRRNPRAANFSLKEERILLALIKKYRHIIESKELNKDSNRTKCNAWQVITKEFNSFTDNMYSPRDVASLKNKYFNLKKRTKAMLRQDLRNSNGLGENSQRLSSADEIEEMIKVVMEKKISQSHFEMDTDANPFLEIDNDEESTELQLKPDPDADDNEGTKKSTEDDDEDWPKYVFKSKRASLDLDNDGSLGESSNVRLTNWSREDENSHNVPNDLRNIKNNTNLRHIQEKHDKYIEECNIKIAMLNKQQEMEKEKHSKYMEECNLKISHLKRKQEMELLFMEAEHKEKIRLIKEKY